MISNQNKKTTANTDTCTHADTPGVIDLMGWFTEMQKVENMEYGKTNLVDL